MPRSAINFGSGTAFHAVVGVSNAALGFSYIVSIGCIRLKRLQGKPLLPARWSLGRYGGIINDISLAFLAVIFVFSFFPTDVMHDGSHWAESFNWAIVGHLSYSLSTLLTVGCVGDLCLDLYTGILILCLWRKPKIHLACFARQARIKPFCD